MRLGQVKLSSVYKTVLVGIAGGENAVYVSIDEKPGHLLEDAESLG